MLSLMTAFPVAGHAVPDGYSINSDSLPATEDNLYRIDLATGAETRLGLIRTNTEETKIDVEGLAFAPDGTLYGVDDQTLTLFPINIDNGRVLDQQDVNLGGLPIGGGNDFGLTFACDGNLYLTSVATRSLYRVSLTGTATRIGTAGSLNANISALASFGNPVQLFGLSNGGLNSSDIAGLYSISAADGTATLIGELGSNAAKYDEAGLAFDSVGQLWAITDRNAVLPSPLPSQILRIDKNTGLATLVAQTTDFGFESLAITIPQGCDSSNGEETAEVVELTVNKEWLYSEDELSFFNTAKIKLECENVLNGDGKSDGNDMSWNWEIEGNDSRTATIYPVAQGNTICHATEYEQPSAVETTNGCAWGIPIDIGDPDKSCTIINTVFVEGIPTLNHYGLWLFAVLMLITGMVAMRRV